MRAIAAINRIGEGIAAAFVVYLEIIASPWFAAVLIAIGLGVWGWGWWFEWK